MLSTTWLRSLSYLFLYALAFLLPFSFYYSAICIVFLTVVWLLTADYKYLAQSLRSKKIVWAFILYFLLFLLSYFYSDNKQQSLFDTQTKVAFLLLPIVIGTGLKLTDKIIDRTFLSYIVGISISASISLLSALYEWISSHSADEFFYHKLVSDFDVNAVYMALYSFMAIAILLLHNWKYFFTTRKGIIIKNILIICLSVYFFLLSARMLILLYVTFLIPLHAYRKYRHNLKSTALIALFIIAAGSFIAFLSIDNPIKQRFQDIFSKNISIVTLDDYSQVEESEFSNFTLRLFFWRICIDNMRENNLWLTGAGNGDAQQLQNSKMIEYKVKNITEEGEKRSPFYGANVHNMFLQSLLMTGLFGFLLLAIITLSPFTYFNIFKASPVYIAFHISSLFFMIQESMFQTQAGIVYYTLIYSIFTGRLHIKKI